MCDSHCMRVFELAQHLIPTNVSSVGDVFLDAGNLMLAQNFKLSLDKLKYQES